MELVACESSLQSAMWVDMCTTLPAVRLGSALIMEARHGEACRYLTRGQLRPASHYDAEHYRQHAHYVHSKSIDCSR